MANDNTLGAPTEGLGQTVTFAASGRQGVPQTTAMKRGNVRNAAQGGAARRTAEALQTLAPQGDTTFKTLARLAGDIIKPQLEAERTLKFAEGWQKAAQSQAIEEIVDEQPAFSRLFGSSSLVDGARAYTAAAKANGLAIELESDMANLRKLSPAEVAKHVADRVTATAGTGDATTNAMIIQQASQGVPQFLKGQAKAYLGYQQELRTDAQAAQLDTQFGLVDVINIGSRDPDSRRDHNDVVEAGVQALNNLSRDTETSPELFSKLLSTSAIKALNAGNLTAYQLLDKSNKIAELTADDQYRVKRAHSVAVTEAQIKLPVSFHNLVLDFHDMQAAGADDTQIQSASDAINAKYKQLTGDTGAYITPKSVMQEQLQARAAERHRLATEDRERAKFAGAAAKEQAENANIVRLLNDAGDERLPISPLVGQPAAMIKSVFTEARIKYAKAPEEHMRFVAKQANSLVYDDVLEQVHAGLLNTADISGNGESLYQYYITQYRPLVVAGGAQGTVIASHYAGKHADKMAKYHQAIQGMPNVGLNEKTSLQLLASQVDAPVASGPRAVAMNKAVKEAAGWLGTGAGIANEEGLTNLIVDKGSKTLEPDAAYKHFIRENRDVAVTGGRWWKVPPGSQRIDDWLLSDKRPFGVGTNEVDKAVKFSLDRSAKEVGMEGDFTVLQIPRGSDTPMLQLRGLGSDGKFKLSTVSAEQIATHWAEHKDVTTRAQKAMVKMEERRKEQAALESQLLFGVTK